MFVISKQVERILVKKTGLSMVEISNLSAKEEAVLIYKKRGKSPIFSKKRDMRKLGRGNPLLARKRIRTIHDVNKRLNEICEE